MVGRVRRWVSRRPVVLSTAEGRSCVWTFPYNSVFSHVCHTGARGVAWSTICGAVVRHTVPLTPAQWLVGWVCVLQCCTLAGVLMQAAGAVKAGPRQVQCSRR